MSFHNAMHPDDLPDYEAEWEERALAIATQEIDDTALTTWLDARQPIFEEFDDADYRHGK